MQFVDRLVEESSQHEKSKEVAQLHRAAQHHARAEPDGEHHAQLPDQIHRRVIESPDAHHDQRRLAQLVAHTIEAAVFFALAHETFDLANPGKVIVQQRIHRRRRPPLQTIPAMRRERVPKRAARQHRKRRQADYRQRHADIKHHRQDNDELQHRDHALFDSVDQHAFHRRDVLQDARHQIARRPIIEPAQRQHLDMRIEVAAQIEDDPLLERVVQNDPERVEPILKQKRQCRDQHERRQPFCVMLHQHLIDDSSRHRWKHRHHQRAKNRASQRSQRHPGIAPQVGKNAGHSFHLVNWTIERAAKMRIGHS